MRAPACVCVLCVCVCVVYAWVCAAVIGCVCCAHLPAVGDAKTDASAVASPLWLRLAGEAPNGLAGTSVKAGVGGAERISRATGENWACGIVRRVRKARAPPLKPRFRSRASQGSSSPPRHHDAVARAVLTAGKGCLHGCMLGRDCRNRRGWKVERALDWTSVSWTSFA